LLACWGYAANPSSPGGSPKKISAPKGMRETQAPLQQGSKTYRAAEFSRFHEVGDAP